jgi:dethiobiotin synthetase
MAIEPVESVVSGARALDEDGALESIDLDAVLMRIEALGADADVVLVEGTGGLLEPLTWEWNAVDLARALAASALVVAPDRQGTISHTLLTLGALELAGLPVCGVALSPPREDDPSTGTNAQAIARLTGIDRVISLPRRSDPAALSADVQPILAWVRATGP